MSDKTIRLKNTRKSRSRIRNRMYIVQHQEMEEFFSRILKFAEPGKEKLLIRDGCKDRVGEKVTLLGTGLHVKINRMERHVLVSSPRGKLMVEIHFNRHGQICRIIDRSGGCICSLPKDVFGFVIQMPSHLSSKFGSGVVFHSSFSCHRTDRGFEWTPCKK